MTISTQSAKAKGRKLQQWVRDRILHCFPWLTLDDVRSTPMGVSSEDVQLSPHARIDFPYHVECKARNKISAYKQYDQAKNDAGHEPILFMKMDRRNPLVVMDAEYFFNSFINKDKK